MVNLKREPVSYRPFKVDPLLSEGLLGVERPGGELEAKVADALFREAGHQRGKLRAEQTAAGDQAGVQAALSGRPNPNAIEGGGSSEMPPLASGSGHDQAKSLLRDFEGFRDTPYWDVNALRTGYGSDTTTRADGSIQRVVQGMKISRDDAERDLDRRVREFSGTAIRQVGSDRWAALPPAAQAALTSVAYNYGSLPRPVVAAVKGGDLGAISNAVASLKSNPSRRQKEAAYIRAAKGAGGGVDPSVQAPKITSGGQSGFRPLPGNGDYARAFNAAGTRTYLQLLENKILDETAQVYDRFKDDPAALAGALRDLRKLQLDDDVFPEIQAEYEVAFERRASAYMRQAQGDMERRAEEKNRADFLGRVSELETQRARDIVSFDPTNPESADAIHRTQKAIDDHYDAAVLHGILDPGQAERAKRLSRNESALGFYTRQAETMAGDDVAGMRETMRADFAAGRLDGLDADGWEKLDARLAAMERTKRTEDNRADTALDKRGQAFVDRAAAGYGIDQAELGRFLLDANTAPNGRAIVDRTLAIVRFAETVRDVPIAQAADKARQLRQAAGATPTDDQIAVIEAAEGMVETTRKSLERDLISHAETSGVIEPTPSLVDAEDGATAAAIIAQRVDGGEDAAAHFGVRPRYLKAGEAAAIEKMIRADPERGAVMAGAIVSGAGPRARDVLAEFGNDAPMIAEAGSILAFGGSARAAEDVIGGYGRPDGKALKGIKAAEASKSFRGEAGGALVYAGDDLARIGRAAAAITRKRIADEGHDPASDEALEIHARAVHEAAGAVFDKGVQFGGFAKVDAPGLFSGSRRVLVSPQIRADRFEAILGAIRDEDLAALPVKPKATVSWLSSGVGMKASMARTLSQAVPIAVAGGYVFAVGDPASDDPQLIEGDDGRAFVLDVLALKHRLAPRVPGGFR